YGTDKISFTIGSDEFNGVTKDQYGKVRPVVTRHYTSFSQAAEENGQSRIYLGIHWSFDKVEGIEQGSNVADYVFKNFLKRSDDDHEMTIDSGEELAFKEVSTRSGPVLSQEKLTKEDTEVENNFSLDSKKQPVNVVVKVESIHLNSTATKDLEDAFASSDL